MKKFKKIWYNILLQASIVVGMFLVYTFMKSGLPKKYRMSDATMNKYIKDIGNIVQNLARAKDDIPSILNKSKNMFDYFLSVKNKGNNFEKNFRTYVQDHLDGFEVHTDALFISIFKLIENEGTLEESIMLDLAHVVYHYTFVYNEKKYTIYVARNIGDGMGESEYLSGFAVEVGVNYYQLSNILFNRFDNQIAISLDKHDSIYVAPLERCSPPKNYRFPQKTYEEMKRDIDIAKAMGMQRSFILYGVPGGGKTTFAYIFSQKVSGKVLKLDATMLRSTEYISTMELKYLLEALECDFIIVDDIDRVNFGEITNLLFLLELIKTLKNKATLLCTANNLGDLDTAILRPGRIDDIYEFTLPDFEERKDFIKATLNDPNLTEEGLDLLSNTMEDWSHAYIQEFCFQYPICGSVENLVKKIEKRKRHLEVGRSHWDENEESELKELLRKK